MIFIFWSPRRDILDIWKIPKNGEVVLTSKFFEFFNSGRYFERTASNLECPETWERILIFQVQGGAQRIFRKFPIMDMWSWQPEYLVLTLPLLLFISNVQVAKSKFIPKKFPIHHFSSTFFIFLRRIPAQFPFNLIHELCDPWRKFLLELTHVSLVDRDFLLGLQSGLKTLMLFSISNARRYFLMLSNYCYKIPYI